MKNSSTLLKDSFATRSLFVLLLIAVIFLGIYLRQRRALVAPEAMSEDERNRAKQLLKG